MECAAGTHSGIRQQAGSIELHAFEGSGLRVHIILGLVPSSTVGVMAGCLWHLRGVRRYASGTSAACTPAAVP